jgi:hypothetical protein
MCISNLEISLLHIRVAHSHIIIINLLYFRDSYTVVYSSTLLNYIPFYSDVYDMHMLFFDNRVVVQRIIVVLCLATFGWPPAIVAAPIVFATDHEPSEFGLINSRRMSSQHLCSHCGYSSAVDNDGTSHHHDRRPAAVTEPYPSATAIYKYGAGHHHDHGPVAVTDLHPSASNTWPGHHHDCRPAAVTEPHPAAANTWAGRQHDRRPVPVTESYPSAADNDGADHHHDRRPTAVNEPHAAAANTRAGHHHDRTTANCPMAESCPIHHEHPPYNKLTPATDETVTADVSASVK